MEPSTIIIVAIILAVAVFFVTKGRRGKGSTADTPPSSPANPKPTPSQPQPPVPSPAPPSQPQPPAPPAPPPESPDVLIDRNGKRPGDDGYDPRIDRPIEEFSPVEPQGAYYGEGPFDPDARWVGPGGPHWTDKDGNHHGPGG